MMDPDRPLSEADVDRMAALHVESIDDSLPALLGVAFARRLYRFFEASSRELVVVERVEGRVASVCVVSFDPASLQSRITRATLGSLVPAAAAAFLAKAAFRAHLRHAVADAIKGSDTALHAPEITYVFTDRQLRGRQLGKRLIERVDRGLAARGFDTYYVKTLDDPDNRAIAFYQANGFARIGSRLEGGRRFVEFHKSPAPR